MLCSSSTKSVALAAVVAVSGASFASAATSFQFDISTLTTTFSGGPVEAGGTFDVTLADNGSTSGIFAVDNSLPVANVGPGDFEFVNLTFNVVDGLLDGGVVEFDDGDDSYTASLAGTGSSITFAGNTLDITALSFDGAFSTDGDDEFEGLDISNFLGADQSGNLAGSLSVFNLTDGGQVANVTGEVEVAAAVVPVPASALAIAPMMLGLFGYRKYKKQRQLA